MAVQEEEQTINKAKNTKMDTHDTNRLPAKRLSPSSASDVMTRLGGTELTQVCSNCYQIIRYCGLIQPTNERKVHCLSFRCGGATKH